MHSTPATLLADAYKVSHRAQYPLNTEIVYSTWIPRASRMPGVNSIVAFGYQSFIKRYLIDYFKTNFFDRPKADVVAEYAEVLRGFFGDENPDTAHIEALHDLGYLPLKIRAVKEGTVVPLRVPVLTIENTLPEFFWLTNYIETLFSCEVWMPSTSATIAFEYRKLLQRYALETNGDTSAVDFQGHDFSMRGMSSLESAANSGMGHLLSFTGTDTIPATIWAQRFYNADPAKSLVGTSIPATEHSVMCAYGQDELSSYRRLITEVYPSGFVSIVSDTWDLWSVLENVVRTLKPEIMARDGRVVIRPDSGDPADIICGDPGASRSAARKGVIEVLWDIFGGTMTKRGFKQLDPHIGAIYGDAITLNRAEDICERLMAKGFASTNMVYGIGSFSYQYTSRDTFGWALKSTHAVIDGEERAIFKDPATDTDKVKKSLTGRVVVIDPGDGAPLKAIDGLTIAEQHKLEPEDALEVVFLDGELVRDEHFSDIRERLLATL